MTGTKSVRTELNFISVVREGVDKVASCRKRSICASNRQMQSEEINFVCECGRIFRQQGDLTRHKCMHLHPDIAIAQDKQGVHCHSF